jgi:hypothetical protein
VFLLLCILLALGTVLSWLVIYLATRKQRRTFDAG